MREKIYRTVHIYEGSVWSVAYKWFMVAIIVLSLIPLTVKETYPVFYGTNAVCLFVSVVDYILRWVSVDLKFHEYRWTAFVKYPFRLISVVDLLAIISLLCPFLGIALYGGIDKILKVFRVVRILRYSKHVRAIMQILEKSRKPLTAVGTLAVGYILISALIVFHAEPQTFANFFEAVYWSTILLTTVGYGDICPVSVVGQFVTMLSSFFGIAIVALPAGIVTAEYMHMLKEDKEEK